MQFRKKQSFLRIPAPEKAHFHGQIRRNRLCLTVLPPSKTDEIPAILGVCHPERRPASDVEVSLCDHSHQRGGLFNQRTPAVLALRSERTGQTNYNWLLSLGVLIDLPLYCSAAFLFNKVFTLAAIPR